MYATCFFSVEDLGLMSSIEMTHKKQEISSQNDSSWLATFVEIRMCIYVFTIQFYFY